ncbi:hypothetical protein KUV85_00650 [Nocardioides panacisoli]|uniref:hypothetical protein n=1 Tax=Nocardioides panacisoli TaxID=627624 RepID=UPI001C6262CC|nr:hypothetical protein [Nocardioides panacisoli]QYJ04223.1 hypothetical protein KUV85_00650 [Nocardioides panacisoli]
MRTEFATAMAEARQQDTSDARIERIKRAVTAEFRAADPAVSVKFTDYFNHVVVPDMVLRWPEESRERLLFLRPSAAEAWLEDDIASLSSHRPVIFTLEDLTAEEELNREERPPASSERLQASAASADTWIADPSAIGGVATARKDSAVIGLLGQALVRGGKGVSTGQAVERLTTATETAFENAEALNAGSMTESVASLEGSLDSQQAGRFTRILRAVWEGNGGAGSAFPTTSSTGPLTDDDLFYLMTTLEDASADFWRRVGKNVTTAQLGRLRIEDPSASLQTFVTANLEFLTSKGIRATGQQVRLSESEEFPRWVVDRGCLAIRGAEWIAHFAARRAEELPPPEVRQGFSLDTLKKRAATSNTAVTRVDFGKGDRGVSYESKERLNVLRDKDLTQLAQDVPGLSVERAALAIPGGGIATLDIPARTALGPTSSVLPIGNLARAALPFLVDLTDDEAEAVGNLLIADGAQGDLFEDIHEADTSDSSAAVEEAGQHTGDEE